MIARPWPNRSLVRLQADIGNVDGDAVRRLRQIGQPNRRLDVGRCDLLAALGTRVQGVDDGERRRRIVAVGADFVAAGDEADVKELLDLRQVLVMLAKDQGGEPIVRKDELQATAPRAARSVVTGCPTRLCDAVATMSTVQRCPTSVAGPSKCTA